MKNLPIFQGFNIVAVESRGIDLLLKLNDGRVVMFCNGSNDLEDYHNQLKNGAKLPKIGLNSVSCLDIKP